MASQKSSGRLGTRLRGKLADAYGQRGHQKADLWYVYSPRTDRDWVIRTDSHFEHFVLTEADPNVIDVDYAPTLAFPDLQGSQLAAIVQYNDGAIQWHAVMGETSEASNSQRRRLADAAEYAGAQLRCFNDEEISSHSQRLWNWQRVLAWMAAARGTALAPYANEIAILVHSRGTATLAEIGQLGARELFPLYTAAVFRLLQHGAVLSDLDEQPLSMLTTFVSRG